MTNTMKHPAPPPGEGLPKLNAGGSILMETEHGLSVCRPLKSLKSSILTAESLDEFMGLLDRYVAFGAREDFIRHYWAKAANHEHPFRASAIASSIFWLAAFATAAIGAPNSGSRWLAAAAIPIHSIKSRTSLRRSCASNILLICCLLYFAKNPCRESGKGL